MSILETFARESSHESGGYVKGVAIATVTQNNDPENLGRVKVRFAWHDEKKRHETYWARVLTPMAGKERGFMMIPEIDDEVLVAFEREDPCHPIVLGGLWNGKARPPLNGNPQNNKRILKSRSGHTLVFDDNSSAGAVELSHTKGRKILFDNSGYTVQDENGNVIKVDSNTGAMNIEAQGELSIKAAAVKIESQSTLDIKASATLSINGSLVKIN